MEISGQNIVDKVVGRLSEEGVRCYDSAIVAKLRQLDAQEIRQLTQLGDVIQWHNDRTKK